MQSLHKFILSTKFWGILFICFALQMCSKKVVEPTIAIIDKDTLSLREYTNRYKLFLQSTNFNDNLQNRYLFLQSLIDEYLLLKWADTTGMIHQPIYQKDIKEMGEQILLNKLYEDQIKTKVEVSEQELRKLYKWSKIRIHARHLFARDETSANQLYERIKGGEEWETLAKETFKDPILANSGGDIGFFKLGDMDPAFEAVAFQLKEGEISPPVKIHTGFSIIQVLEREYDPFLIEDEFQIQKAKLQRIAFSFKKLPTVKTYTDSIESSLNINFFDAGLETIWNQIDLIHQTKGEVAIQDADLVCVTFNNPKGQWSVNRTFTKLMGLSDRQKRLIVSKENLKDIISGLIIREELLKKARQLRIDSSEEYKKAFVRVKNGYTISQIIDVISQNARPNEAEMESYYRSHSHDFITEPQFEVAEIVVADSALSDELFNKILSGEKFEDIAFRFSIRKESAVNGGYLGWGTPDQFGQVKHVLLQTKAGDLIGPLEVFDRYVILKVLNVNPSSQLSFEEVKGQIENALEFQTHRKAFISFRDSLKMKTSISIDSTQVKKFILNEVM